MSEEKNTIYLVTAGSYSDYRMVAAFSSRYKANNFIQSFYKGHASLQLGGVRIEKYVLDKYKVPKNYKYYIVSMCKNGDVLKCEHSCDKYNIGEVRQCWNDGKKIENVKDILVFANNEEHAIKIANEKRTRLIAENLWDSIK